MAEAAEVRNESRYHERYTVWLNGHQIGQWYASRDRAEAIARFLNCYADDVVNAALSDEEVALLLQHRGIDTGSAFERVKAALDKAKGDGDGR